jgi:hypothetical protein
MTTSGDDYSSIFSFGGGSCGLQKNVRTKRTQSVEGNSAAYTWGAVWHGRARKLGLLPPQIQGDAGFLLGPQPAFGLLIGPS